MTSQNSMNRCKLLYSTITQEHTERKANSLGRQGDLQFGETEGGGRWWIKGRGCQRAIVFTRQDGRGGRETPLHVPHEACFIELEIDGIGRRTQQRVTSQTWETPTFANCGQMRATCEPAADNSLDKRNDYPRIGI